ncbi:putative glutamine amido transferase [Salmonella enterica subsp. enterica]|uniref:Putative glutamine amido transferase n=1 Tax=Salmonella enterica I TaxID=59201 RepID=A0A3S4FUP6_SALET|nr:putative glutamine amido transferase [Salmonella enterica subsp. enterica]
MLLSDGRYVMAFCSTHLHWITRRAPFGVATLVDQDMEIDFSSQTTPNDVVTVIATQPLTGNETWQKDYARRMGVILPRRAYNLRPAVAERLRDSTVCSRRNVHQR